LADNSYWEKVFEVTSSIPKGRVSTYGAIAEYLSLGSARMVGWALNHVHGNENVPAHRVVNRIGELSGRLMFATPTLMEERLVSEGIAIENHKVKDFKKVFWHPGNDQFNERDTKDSIDVQSILDLDRVAQEILKRVGQNNILLFEGGLGAGKTTTIKAICKALNVIDNPSSPTFALINEYKTIENDIVYHMDLYRLNSIDEALDIGIEDYLYSDKMVLIEWSEIIHPLLEKAAVIHIERQSNGSRRITVQLVQFPAG
jgi:methylated-DNA-protein-cysteine methyltransferase related protein